MILLLFNMTNFVQISWQEDLAYLTHRHTKIPILTFVIIQTILPRMRLVSTTRYVPWVTKQWCYSFLNLPFVPNVLTVAFLFVLISLLLVLTSVELWLSETLLVGKGNISVYLPGNLSLLAFSALGSSLCEKRGRWLEGMQRLPSSTVTLAQLCYSEPEMKCFLLL